MCECSVCFKIDKRIRAVYNSKTYFVNGNHVVMKMSKYAIFSKYFAINLSINHNYNITVMIKIYYY